MPDDLSFDLENNWGGIPMDLRIWLAKAELASGIPGLARAGGVRWWESFRAKQPVVSMVEAAAIAAANPELARTFVNYSDGAAAKKGIDSNITKLGWPKPVDYNGWIAGSFGLGDILGSTFVHAGIHTEGKKAGPNGLPFVFAPSAKEMYQSYEGQIGALVYIVYRVINGDLKVVIPKIQAEPAVQDSENTWANIFAAYAYPASYAKNNDQAKASKANYLKRAKEIGINLADVAFPWPPGKSYKSWDFGDFWARLLAYAPQSVKNSTDGGYESENQVQAQTPAEEIVTPNGIVARVLAGNGVEPDEEAPLIIILHGRDASDAQMIPVVQLASPARYAFMRSPTKRWFDEPLMGDPDLLADQIKSVAAAVVASGQHVTGFFNTSNVFLVGYSQGAAIAYHIAAKGLVTSIVAVAGYIPPELFPEGSVKTKVWAVAGAKDANVPIAKAQEAYDAFVGAAPTQGLTVVANGTHAVTSLAQAMNVAIAAMVKAG